MHSPTTRWYIHMLPLLVLLGAVTHGGLAKPIYPPETISPLARWNFYLDILLTGTISEMGKLWWICEHTWSNRMRNEDT